LLSSRSEIERIRNSLIVTAEVLAAQLVVDVLQGSPLKLAHLAIRLPAVITRLKRLIVACETMIDRIATTENRLLAGMALDIGLTTGLVVNPPVRLASKLIGGKANAPGTLSTIAERLMNLDKRRTPTIRIEKYGSAAIAYIPGTQSGSFGWTSNPMDMKTNLQQISGRRSNVEIGLGKALAAAGVKASDRVLLVGHSQGGLVAISAAGHSRTADFPYKVEKVITFGSPVGSNYPNRLPEVISVENKYDLVPVLDGKANPKASNWLTLEGEVPGSPISAHLMESYCQIAAEIDQAGKLPDIFALGDEKADVSYFELSQGPDMRG
jgi:pimeloyl-ACP methyl ester carboxylesterase